MPNYLSKQKILVVAILIFAITMSSVFLFVEDKETSKHNSNYQAFILNDFESKNLDEAGYRNLLNNQDDDFIIVNTDRTFRYISPDMEKIHGYTIEEMQFGKVNVLTFIHPKDLPEFSNILMEFHKKIAVLSNVGPIRVKTINGDYMNYLITLIPFTNKEGERIWTGVILKNVEKPLGDTENKI